MTRISRWVATIGILALPLGAAGAQQGAATLSVAGTAGPRVEGTRVGIQVQGARLADEAAPAPQEPALKRRGVPQMIVGGAAIIVGGFVGDDTGGLISIAGLGIGLWGLYLFLT